MRPVDFLEHGGGHFYVRLAGQVISLRSPVEMHYQQVLACLMVGLAPGIPLHGVSQWQSEVVFDRWRAAWDLPDFEAARRLAYLADHYSSALNSDLLPLGVDLGQMWRARRWRTLLDVIDRLPPWSQYAASVSSDPEHAKMLAEQVSKGAGSEKPKDRPALTTWTPEVAVMTSILDAVRQLDYHVCGFKLGKKAGAPPEPAPRPVTPLQAAMERARYDRRQSAHEKLVARVLPHKKV